MPPGDPNWPNDLAHWTKDDGENGLFYIMTGKAGWRVPVSAVFSRAGVLTVSAGVGRFLITSPGRLIGAVATVGTAPTGASVLIDVNKNGTTIYTTQANRPAIAAGANASSLPPAVPDITALVPGDYITVDVDQIGVAIAGADLVVEVLLTGA